MVLGMRANATIYGCTHAEAFHLMQYLSTSTTMSELIWNSRDGVTPFCITMRDGSEGVHANWHGDKFDPYHVPAIGDRVFVNLTLAAAIGYRTTYVEKWWLGGNCVPPMSEMYATREEAIRKLAEADVCGFGNGTSPHLVTVDEWLLNDITTRRPPRLGGLIPRQSPTASGRFA